MSIFARVERFSGLTVVVWSIAIGLAACGKPEAKTVDIRALEPAKPPSLDASAPFGPPGTLLSSRGFSSDHDMWATAVSCNKMGQLAVAGRFDERVSFGRFDLVESGTGLGLFVAWLDANGEPTLARAFGDIGFTGQPVVASAPDGDWIVAGAFEGVLDFGSGPLKATATSGFLARLSPTGTARWAKTFGGAAQQKVQDVAVSDSGDIVVVGSFAHGAIDLGTGPLTGHDLDDAFVALLDRDGTTRWAKSYGDEWSQTATAVAVDGEGNIAVGGELDGTMNLGVGTIGVAVDPKRGPTKKLGWVASLTAGGRARWSRTIEATGSSNVRDVAVARGNAILVAGLFTGDLAVLDPAVHGQGNTDGYVARFDGTTGGPRWAVRAGTDEKGGLEQANSIAVDAEGNVAVFGSRTGSEGIMPMYGSWFASVGPTGTLRFVRNNPHANVDLDGHALAMAPSGRALAVGWYGQAVDLGRGPLENHGSYSVFLAAFVP